MELDLTVFLIDNPKSDAWLVDTRTKRYIMILKHNDKYKLFIRYVNFLTLTKNLPLLISSRQLLTI